MHRWHLVLQTAIQAKLNQYPNPEWPHCHSNILHWSSPLLTRTHIPTQYHSCWFPLEGHVAVHHSIPKQSFSHLYLSCSLILLAALPTELTPQSTSYISSMYIPTKTSVKHCYGSTYSFARPFSPCSTGSPPTSSVTLVLHLTQKVEVYHRLSDSSGICLNYLVESTEVGGN